MRKSPRSKKNKTIGRGPIARKVIASARYHLQKKVTNLSDWREARIRAEDFQKTIISQNKLTEYDPVHGLYVPINALGNATHQAIFIGLFFFATPSIINPSSDRYFPDSAATTASNEAPT